MIENQTPTAQDVSQKQALALRGERPLEPDVLRGHLAALLELPNVGVLLGAGASSCAGGWLVSDIGLSFSELCERSEMLHAARQLLEVRGFEFANIEKAWSALTQLTEGPQAAAQVAQETLEAAQTCLRALRAILIEAALLDTQDIDRAWREGDVGEASPLTAHRSLLRKFLLSRRPGQPAPWVFTTNYDMAVEWAAEEAGFDWIDGFSGVHRRRFRPEVFDLGWYRVVSHGEARFGNTYFYLAKLHGSLSWREDAGTIAEVPLPPGRLAELAKRLPRTPGECPGPPKLSDDLSRAVLIPPSAAKYVETVGFVHGELFRRFAEFVSRPQTVLFVNGYSFSDSHLNRLILGALLNPTFHLVVCCYGYSIRGGTENDGPSIPRLVPADACPPGDGEERDGSGDSVRDDAGGPTPGKASDGAPGAPETSAPSESGKPEEVGLSLLERLIAQRHPHVTFLAGGAADFAGFVRSLPDPAMLDRDLLERRRHIECLLEELSKGGER